MKVGDVVRLKSGGPPMTILRGSAELYVGWFNSAGEYRETTVPAVALVKADASQ